MLRIAGFEEAFSCHRGAATTQIEERGVPLGQLVRRDTQQSCSGARKELRSNRVYWLRNVAHIECSTGSADHLIVDSVPNWIIDIGEEVQRMTEAENQAASSRWKNSLASGNIRPSRRLLACPERLHERAQRWAGSATNVHANDDCLLDRPLSTAA